jgi:hypothetical protein
MGKIVRAALIQVHANLPKDPDQAQSEAAPTPSSWADAAGARSER